MSNVSLKRKPHIDSLKCFAIFIIFLTHFVTHFNSPYTRFWFTMPTSLFMRGLTGKFGVAILGVCLGYFAYNSKARNSSVYLIRRYFYFFISGLFVNTLIAALVHFHLIANELLSSGGWVHAVKTIILNSILLKDGIYPTFWCMNSFCLASILAYLNGQKEVKSAGIVIEVLLLWISGQIWVAICLFGCLVSRATLCPSVNRMLSYRFIRVILFLFAILIIQRNESDLTYFLDAVSASLLVLLSENSPLFQKMLNWRVSSFIGENVMGIFLIHPHVYMIIGPQLFRLTSGWPYSLSFLVTILICWFVTVLLAIPATRLLNASLKRFTEWLSKIQAATWQRGLSS